MDKKAIRSRVAAPAWAVLVLALPGARSAQPFTVEETNFVFDGSDIDVVATLESASRWSTIPQPGLLGNPAGLDDGIIVSVAPDFAEAFGASTQAEIDAYQSVVIDSFAAWESPVLYFSISFDGRGTFGGHGLELDVFATDDSNPLFSGNHFQGIAMFLDPFHSDRGLTNGEILPGPTIVHADVYVHVDRVLAVTQTLTEEEGFAFLQRLLVHEIGHTLGLEHPNDFFFANFDTDFDPTNPIDVDPNDPFVGLMVSPNFDPNAMMSTTLPFEAQLFEVPQNDDIAGRDVLYPIPEPSTALLRFSAVGVLAALAVGRRPTKAAQSRHRRGSRLGADWPATPGGFEHGVNPFNNIYGSMHRRPPAETRRTTPLSAARPSQVEADSAKPKT